MVTFADKDEVVEEMKNQDLTAVKNRNQAGSGKKRRAKAKKKAKQLQEYE